MGVILQFVRIMLLTSYVIIARHNYGTQHHHNATIQCIFLEEYGYLSSSFDIRWMALQGFQNSVSTFMHGLGGIEYMCA